MRNIHTNMRSNVMKNPTYVLNATRFSTSGNVIYASAVYFDANEFDKALKAYYAAINGNFADCDVKLRNIKTQETLFIQEQQNA